MGEGDTVSLSIYFILCKLIYFGLCILNLKTVVLCPLKKENWLIYLNTSKMFYCFVQKC